LNHQTPRIDVQRRIAVVTTSRADYGHLYWPMREIEAHPDLALDLIVSGAHLSPTFGRTVDLIESDGFAVRARVECLDPEDSDTGMARTIGVATTGLTAVLADLRPDILLLIADRYEMLAPASVALALRIPMAHIEGGDVSEGAIDDAVRNALTKMAHLHFTPTEIARQRVLAMGEETWRVVHSGAPSLDHLRLSNRPDLRALEAALGQTVADRLCVVAYHPVTLKQDTTLEADALFEALATWQHQMVFCFPNADAGSSELARRAKAFCSTRKDATLYVNLDHLVYWALLERAELLVGNSSSGIMESPSLGLPAVDIGERQYGRTRAANIIHAEPTVDAIANAMRRASDPGFRDSLQGLVNPYGDGHASERIVAGLAAAPSRDVLLHKRALALDPSGTAFCHDD
jgi:UDP-N-acetylglucosamine 2-epimerase (non-hydrolysing)/GDP/UDP-N,N'-diacetylbacillosamine 2-epimerase (hydrolysing)